MGVERAMMRRAHHQAISGVVRAVALDRDQVRSIQHLANIDLAQRARQAVAQDDAEVEARLSGPPRGKAETPWLRLLNGEGSILVRRSAHSRRFLSKDDKE